MDTVSEEALLVLEEILQNENNPDYWKTRFENLDTRNDAILRGCFKELSDSRLIKANWADNYPYLIQILKDGYLYKPSLEEKELRGMSQFEKELRDLLDRAKSIKKPINAAPIGTDISEYNKPSSDWMNDVQIFYEKYLKDHPLGNRIRTLLFHRGLGAYSEVVSCLDSVSRDSAFLKRMNGEPSMESSAPNMTNMYDVFLSHANKDKADIVERLYESLNKLGINIFYDKASLEWGDNWKDRILDGTQKAEFAIIVISENFFDSEWNERELREFLRRQNKNGQKLILPIVHNISNEDLRKKYPLVADIQAIDSRDYSCDEIALMFARQLIKRLKN